MDDKRNFSDRREGTSFQNLYKQKRADWVAERISRPEITLGLVTLKVKPGVMERHTQGLAYESVPVLSNC